MPWFVYIVRCRDGSLYTGVSTDPGRRIAEHNGDDARGSKYTRSRRPVEMVYCEPCIDHSASLQRERVIKRMNRSNKLSLIGEQVIPEAGAI